MKQLPQHFYWFAPYNLSCPSTRYRGKLPLEYLKAEQLVTFDFFFPERSIKAYLRFVLLLLKILFFRKKNSKIVIQKICSNRFYANALKLLIRLRPKNTLYDIDDAEYLRQDTKTLHFFLKHCACIHVGSQALADYCAVFNEHIQICTSPVFKHSFKKQKRNTIPTIGWVGDFGNGKAISKNFAHKTSLFQLLFPALKKLNTPIRLLLIGVKKEDDLPEVEAYFKDCPHVQLEIPFPLYWENDLWLYERMLEFDIGVSPLVDHPFNQAKSAFKAKQYLSCGVPTIASDVGENKTFVHHKKNGFLCNNSDDFIEAILFFIQMDDAHYSNYIQNALEGFTSFSLANYSKMLLD